MRYSLRTIVVRTLVHATAMLLIGGVGAARADHFQQKVDEALALTKPDERLRELEREAYRGNLRASYQLGLLLREGTTAAADPEAAYDHLEDAATPDWIRMNYKQGLPEAQYTLGVMHRDGAGAERDAEEAAEWLERAAEQGHGEAQIALARLYLAGEGVDRDPALAYFWARLAARESALREAASEVSRRAAAALTPEQRKTLARRLSTWTADTR